MFCVILSGVYSFASRLDFLAFVAPWLVPRENKPGMRTGRSGWPSKRSGRFAWRFRTTKQHRELTCKQANMNATSKQKISSKQKPKHVALPACTEAVTHDNLTQVLELTAASASGWYAVVLFPRWWMCKIGARHFHFYGFVQYTAGGT